MPPERRGSQTTLSILRDWARDRGDGLANGGRRLALLATRGQVSVPATPQSRAAKPSLSCPITGPPGGARRPAPNAGEEFACGNLRPETEAGVGFPTGRDERLMAQPIDTAVLARI